MRGLARKNLERANLERENLERVKGIEPLSKAWEAFVLPLNYTRMLYIFRTAAFDYKSEFKAADMPSLRLAWS